MKKFYFSMIACLLVMGSLHAQRSVSGRVTDDVGEGLPGVNVVIKGTTTGTTTDIDGNYNLQVNDGDVLVFSFVGFESQEINSGTRSVIDVTMGGVTELQEVIVQAYGSSTERLNTQQIEVVGKEDFENFPVVSPQNMLQGQAAGVQINSTSGLIGSSQVARIRGVTTFGANTGSSPLYVIDGVPLNDGSGQNSANQMSTSSGATSLDPLMNLNPNEIESMTVLKDAAATALYGSRGANGVILITTKKGKNGTSNLNFDWFTGWMEPTVEKDVLNFEQWKELRTRLGTDPSTFPEEGTDWSDLVRQTGRTNSYSISSSGGNERSTYYIGGTYFNSSSYVIGNEIEKFNGRINLEHEATDFLKIGTNIAVSHLVNDRISAENSTGSPWTVQYLNTPNQPAFDADGNPIPAGFNNPILLDQERRFELTSRRITGNVFAEAELFEGFTARTDWGLDWLETDQEFRDNEILTPGGFGSKDIRKDNKWLTTNSLSYTKSFSDHTITVFAAQSFETSYRKDTYAESTTYISDELPNTASGAQKTDAFNTGSEWALLSYIGRINYNFAERYIIEGSYRRDGSSRFGADKRYGNFGAVSATWLISQESFFPQNDIVNFLKLTTSYGSSGNDRILNFAAQGLYGAANYNGQSGLYLVQPANPELTWETTKQFDVGINAQFFRSRMSLDVSYWIKDTEGILLDVPIPSSTGVPGPSRIENIGEMQNKGIDLTLNGDILDMPNGFRWNSSLNVGFLKNEVTSLPESVPVDEQGVPYVGQAGFSDVRAILGRSAQEYYLIEYLGINSETGDAEWVDADGNPTTVYTDAVRRYNGSALPDFTGGWSNNFSYKGISLRVFFNFVSGGQVYLAENEFSENILGSGVFNNTTRSLDMWTPDNTDAVAPALTSSTLGTWDNESTRHLFDASYIRLKNVTLAYNLPQSLLAPTGVVKSARVYVMGQNLATFASDVFDNGSDPEVNSNGRDPGTAQGESFYASPQPRTITVGVSIGL
ncbi:SusC/RagA family TonB-linked outer membrane protein [Ekhidna sp.]|uniref:SusC/RagA family TonB-linked outer membrane protein n=1 Tax=Ekhidna sp. TaxID=2608089 RepID=UPI003C7E2879